MLQEFSCFLLHNLYFVMREGCWTKGEGDGLSNAVVNMSHGYTDRQQGDIISLL
jgi:hypothetical protein